MAGPDVDSKVAAATVDYHWADRRRASRRSFPPPLSSMSSRDGPCLKMCPRRQDGRLIVEAVPVRPRGYLQANRQDGRLCLSFIECSARGQSAASKSTTPPESYFPVVEDKGRQEQKAAMPVKKEEMVGRETLMEVKVHRSTLVINNTF